MVYKGMTGPNLIFSGHISVTTAAHFLTF